MTRVIKVGGRPQLDPALPRAIAVAFSATAHRAGDSLNHGSASTVQPPRDARGDNAIQKGQSHNSTGTVPFVAPSAARGPDHAFANTDQPRQSDRGLIIVHGGGDEISMLQRMFGATAEFKDGRRVTSETDLEIIRMALSGSANKRLVSALISEGIRAVGLSGEDASLLTADPLAEKDYGYVGVPSGVNVALLKYLLAGGYLPVLSPVSRSTDTNSKTTLNVNGDDAAAAIAIAVNAEELLLVSDVEGVLQSGRAIEALDPHEAQRLIDDGTAQGGMGAKLRAALTALEGGVKRVRISDIAAIEQFDRGTILTPLGSAVI